MKIPSAAATGESATPNPSSGAMSDALSGTPLPGVPPSPPPAEISEIAYDPSTHAPVHLAPPSGTSAQQTHPHHSGNALYPGTVYGEHIKQSSLVNPPDVAAICVGSGLILGGLLVMLLQLMKEAGSPLSLVAMVLGLLTALLGIGVLGTGLRRFGSVAIPVTVLSGLLTLVTFVAAFVPPAEPAASQVARSTGEPSPPDRDDRVAADVPATRRPFRSEREQPGTDGRSSPARPRQNNAAKGSAAPSSATANRRSDSGSARPKKQSGSDNPFESSRDDMDSGVGDSGTLVRKSQFARDLDRIWKETDPGQRHEHVEEMKQLVADGREEAGREERGFWEMYQQRLDSLDAFGRGRWINLDFKNGPEGWHVTNPAAFHIASPEAARIDTRDAAGGNTLVVSPDLFYGPVCLNFDLQLSGSRTGGPAGIGIFFTSRDDPDSISGNDCVIAFDPGLTTLKTGSGDSIDEAAGTFSEAIGRETGPVSLSHLSGQLDLSRPVSLQVNLCRGCLQVFANGRILLEQFDPAIPEGHSIGFAVLPRTASGYSFGISKCRVRRWKSGPPPDVTAFVEQDYMYFQDLVREFKDLAHLHYRLALAQVGNRRIGEAAQSALRAEQLGLAPGKLALIHALEHERNGEDDQALKAYASSRPSATGRRDPETGKPHTLVDPHELAKACHAWFVVTHHDRQYRGRGIALQLDDHFHSAPWVVARIQAALAAHRREFELATRLLEEVAEAVPVNFRGEFNRQLEAYQANTAWYRDRGSLSFYHRVKVRIQPEHVYYEGQRPDVPGTVRSQD